MFPHLNPSPARSPTPAAPVPHHAPSIPPAPLQPMGPPPIPVTHPASFLQTTPHILDTPVFSGTATPAEIAQLSDSYDPMLFAMGQAGHGLPVGWSGHGEFGRYLQRGQWYPHFLAATETTGHENDSMQPPSRSLLPSMQSDDTDTSQPDRKRMKDPHEIDARGNEPGSSRIEGHEGDRLQQTTGASKVSAAAPGGFEDSMMAFHTFDQYAELCSYLMPTDPVNSHQTQQAGSQTLLPLNAVSDPARIDVEHPSQPVFDAHYHPQQIGQLDELFNGYAGPPAELDFALHAPAFVMDSDLLSAIDSQHLEASSSTSQLPQQHGVTQLPQIEHPAWLNFSGGLLSTTQLQAQSIDGSFPMPQRYQPAQPDNIPPQDPIPRLPTPEKSTNPVAVTPSDTYHHAINALLSNVPSKHALKILVKIFYDDAFAGEGVWLLQSRLNNAIQRLLDVNIPEFGDNPGTTLSVLFAILAITINFTPSGRISTFPPAPTHPENKGRVYLMVQPRGLVYPFCVTPAPSDGPADDSSLAEHYFQLSLYTLHLAEEHDDLSAMMIMAKLLHYRYTSASHRLIGSPSRSTGHLAQAINMANRLGYHKEDPQLSGFEREIQRRIIWSLYIADCDESFHGSSPRLMSGSFRTMPMPSTLADDEVRWFNQHGVQLPSNLPRAKATRNTALILHASIALRLEPILKTFTRPTSDSTTAKECIKISKLLFDLQQHPSSYFSGTIPLDHPGMTAHCVRVRSYIHAYRLAMFRVQPLRNLKDPCTRASLAYSAVCCAGLQFVVYKVDRVGLVDDRYAPGMILQGCVMLGVSLYVTNRLLSSNDEAGRQEWDRYTSYLMDGTNYIQKEASRGNLAGWCIAGANLLPEMQRKIQYVGFGSSSTVGSLHQTHGHGNIQGDGATLHAASEGGMAEVDAWISKMDAAGVMPGGTEVIDYDRLARMIEMM